MNAPKGRKPISVDMLTAAAVLLQMSVSELQVKLAHESDQNSKEPCDRLLTPDEAAEMLSISRRTLQEYIKRGILRPVRLAAGHRRFDGRVVGGRIGIPLSQVQAIITGSVNIVSIASGEKQEGRL